MATTVAAPAALVVQAPRRRAAVRVEKRRVHHKAKTRIPLAVVAGFIPYAVTLKEAYKNEGMGGVMKVAPKIIGYDGYSGKWNVKYMFEQGVMGSILGGVAVHMVMNKLGVNRRLAKLIPWVSI